MLKRVPNTGAEVGRERSRRVQPAATPREALGPFEVERAEGRLWRDGVEVKLRPRTAALLRVLLAAEERLLDKPALVRAVWGDKPVDDSTVRKTLQELRVALDDQRDPPRLLETVHGRGIRLRAPERAAALIVGRDAELARLRAWMAAAGNGAGPRLAVVSGPPGIGKSALLAALAATADAAVARGAGVAGHGEHEPFLAVLAALDALDDEAGGSGRERPDSASLYQLERAVVSRAMAGPLLLVLDDLHWADPSTLDLIGVLARRDRPRELFVLAAHRDVPGARIAALARDLEVRGRCHRLRLEALAPGDTRCLAARLLGVADLDDGLGHRLDERSGGVPLFIEALARSVPPALPPAARVKRLREALDAPSAAVRDAVEGILDAVLAAAIPWLEIAGILGSPVSAQLAAAIAAVDVEAAEDGLAELVGAGVLVREASPTRLPDGSVGETFAFRHALYRERAYDRMLGARRRRLHREAAAALRAAYGDDAAQVAGELALHYGRAEMLDETLRWGVLAARHARHAGGAGAALDQIEAVLAVADAQPGAAVDSAHQHGLALEVARLVARGAVSPRSMALMEAALAQGGTAPPADCLVLRRGLWVLRGAMGGDLRAALAGVNECVPLAEQTGDPGAVTLVQIDRAETLYSRGDIAEAEAALAAARPGVDQAAVTRPLDDFGAQIAVRALIQQGWISWMRGAADAAARAALADAVATAERLGDPASLCQALMGQAWLAFCERREATARPPLAALAEVAAGYELSHWRGLAAALACCCDVLDGRLVLPDSAEPALADLPHTRDTEGLLLICLAQAYGRAHRWREGLAAIRLARAVTERTGQLLCLSEMHRLEGELRAQGGERATAVACHERALDVARGQGAVAYALRAACSLVEAAQHDRPPRALRALLERALADVPDPARADVQAARGLLATL